MVEANLTVFYKWATDALKIFTIPKNLLKKNANLYSEMTTEKSLPFLIFPEEEVKYGS